MRCDNIGQIIQWTDQKISDSLQPLVTLSQSMVFTLVGYILCILNYQTIQFVMYVSEEEALIHEGLTWFGFETCISMHLDLTFTSWPNVKLRGFWSLLISYYNHCWMFTFDLHHLDTKKSLSKWYNICTVCIKWYGALYSKSFFLLQDKKL